MSAQVELLSGGPFVIFGQELSVGTIEVPVLQLGLGLLGATREASEQYRYLRGLIAAGSVSVEIGETVFAATAGFDAAVDVAVGGDVAAVAGSVAKRTNTGELVATGFVADVSNDIELKLFGDVPLGLGGVTITEADAILARIGGSMIRAKAAGAVDFINSDMTSIVAAVSPKQGGARIRGGAAGAAVDLEAVSVANGASRILLSVLGDTAGQVDLEVGTFARYDAAGVTKFYTHTEFTVLTTTDALQSLMAVGSQSDSVLKYVDEITWSNDTANTGGSLTISSTWVNIAGTLTQIGATKSLADDFRSNDAGIALGDVIHNAAAGIHRLRVDPTTSGTRNWNVDRHVFERVLV